MKKQTKKLSDAAARLRRATRERNTARAALARISKPADPCHVVDKSAAWMDAALRRVRERLLKIPGVVGVGLGARVQNGMTTDEPCLTVLVRKKAPLAHLRRRRQRVIPRVTRVGKRKLGIDVVELGDLERQVQVGSDVGPAAKREAGTLGVFARDTGDNSSVAVTAMHVSGLTQVPGDATSVPFCTPSRVASNGGPLFANLVRGTKSRVDAAKLRLNAPQPVGGVIPGLGPIAGWRPLTFPGDRHATVFMFGARSGLQQGFIANTAIDLPSEKLESAILVNISSVRGDSGAVLVDSERFVLGFLVGAGNTQLGNLRDLCPVGLVFFELGCDIP